MRAASVVSRLTETFRDIAEGRMRALPVMNPSLRVEAVGFQTWAGRPTGVLIAPWFVNLLLFPGQDEDWRALLCGRGPRV